MSCRFRWILSFEGFSHLACSVPLTGGLAFASHIPCIVALGFRGLIPLLILGPGNKYCFTNPNDIVVLYICSCDQKKVTIWSRAKTTRTEVAI